MSYIESMIFFRIMQCHIQEIHNYPIKKRIKIFNKIFFLLNHQLSILSFVSLNQSFLNIYPINIFLKMSNSDIWCHFIKLGKSGGYKQKYLHEFFLKKSTA